MIEKATELVANFIANVTAIIADDNEEIKIKESIAYYVAKFDSWLAVDSSHVADKNATNATDATNAKNGDKGAIKIITEITEILTEIASEIAQFDDCAKKAVPEIVKEYKYYTKVLLGVEVISFLFYLGEIVMAWIMARTMKD